MLQKKPTKKMKNILSKIPNIAKNPINNENNAIDINILNMTLSVGV